MAEIGSTFLTYLIAVRASHAFMRLFRYHDKEHEITVVEVEGGGDTSSIASAYCSCGHCFLVKDHYHVPS